MRVEIPAGTPSPYSRVEGPGKILRDFFRNSGRPRSVGPGASRTAPTIAGSGDVRPNCTLLQSRVLRLTPDGCAATPSTAGSPNLKASIRSTDSLRLGTPGRASAGPALGQSRVTLEPKTAWAAGKAASGHNKTGDPILHGPPVGDCKAVRIVLIGGSLRHRDDAGGHTPPGRPRPDPKAPSSSARGSHPDPPAQYPQSGNRRQRNRC